MLEYTIIKQWSKHNIQQQMDFCSICFMTFDLQFFYAFGLFFRILKIYLSPNNKATWSTSAGRIPTYLVLLIESWCRLQWRFVHIIQVTLFLIKSSFATSRLKFCSYINDLLRTTNYFYEWLQFYTYISPFSSGLLAFSRCVSDCGQSAHCPG